MGEHFLSIKINRIEAAAIAKKLYKLEGEVIPLPGEIDFNFRINSRTNTYLLKISRPGANREFIEFQTRLLNHIANQKPPIATSRIIPDINGNLYSMATDTQKKPRFIRLLSWLPGRLWSAVNPHSHQLLLSLGQQTGLLTRALIGFDHPKAHRDFEWDLAQAAWTKKYMHEFDKKQRSVLTYFMEKFTAIQPAYQPLRKGVIHNDVNNYNILVSEDKINPKVAAIIDFGDAIYSQIINEPAVAIAYAIIGKPDVLTAAIPLVQGFHQNFPLKEDELHMLYVLVGMRLVISVTKSLINRRQEPDNSYLLISEKTAWESLYQWRRVNEDLASHRFRAACGFSDAPDKDEPDTGTNRTFVK